MGWEPEATSAYAPERRVNFVLTTMVWLDEKQFAPRVQANRILSIDSLDFIGFRFMNRGSGYSLKSAIETSPNFNSLMATLSPKPRKARAKKAGPSAPKFEIVEEEPNPVAESWSSFRQLLAPLLETSRNVLGDVYSSIAQAVLEQKEELEDRRAERKAEQWRVSRKLSPRRKAATPHLLEAGSLSKTASTKAPS